MRQIKFRGKRVDNGEWVYGDLTRYSERMSYITADLVEGEVYQVYTSTVGQYTGLKDKNGKEIFEGDIVTANWYDYDEPNHCITGIVEFSQGWGAYWIADYETKEFSEINGCGFYAWDIEIISNIHDNPDLLEVPK